MELARGDRPATLAALQRLRDQSASLRISLEATLTLARYSDGEPGAHNVPPQADADELADEGALAAPALPASVEAALDDSERRGGDAGDVGGGNGGGA